MRLFVGVEIGQAAAAAGDLVAELRRRCGRLAPRARVTWVAPSRMHVTLAFIGDADDAQVAAVEAVLREPLPVAPFDLGLGRLGAFPVRGAPRVLWVGVAPGGEALVAIERHVRARLASAGLSLEDRAFTPHVTLGRVRQPAGLRPDALFEGLPTSFGRQTPVDGITLYESRLAPTGSVYVARVRTPLRDPR